MINRIPGKSMKILPCETQSVKGPDAQIKGIRSVLPSSVQSFDVERMTLRTSLLHDSKKLPSCHLGSTPNSRMCQWAPKMLKVARLLAPRLQMVSNSTLAERPTKIANGLLKDVKALSTLVWIQDMFLPEPGIHCGHRST
jgi:hypothetical protein